MKLEFQLFLFLALFSVLTMHPIPIIAFLLLLAWLVIKVLWGFFG